MEPIPESEAALDEYLSFGDVDIRDQLLEFGQRARSIVPELVGLSLTVVEDGVTFTLVASDERAAAIDLTQYVDGGPCQEGMENGEVIQVDINDLFDEQRWLSYARASAAHGVASSLSLPILEDGEPVLGYQPLCVDIRRVRGAPQGACRHTRGVGSRYRDQC
jgi:hypothetical protein